jgi:nitrogen fixation NifU-like protein
MSDLYGEKVMDHFMHPRNVGEIKEADGVGETGNPTCGDIMKIFLKVGERPIAKSQKQEEFISDIKFQTFGCGAAVATSSMVTEMVKGKTLKEAEKISNQAVAEALGGLPPIKMHCSNLAANALHEAIENYKKSVR